MSLYLARNQQGQYVIKENRWVKGDDGPGHVEQRYIGYVGKEKTLSRSKAERICEEKDVAFENLAGIKDLEIVEGDRGSGDVTA